MGRALRVGCVFSRQPECLESKFQPVGVGYDLAAESNKKKDKDHAASHPGAGTAPAEAEATLQPVEDSVQQEQLQQPCKTTLISVHSPSHIIASLYGYIRVEREIVAGMDPETSCGLPPGI